MQIRKSTKSDIEAVGDADLDRGTEHIPEVSLYERYW